ncbi:MAG: hypothetical protein AAF372_02920 [Pseudomonadota bacterium]
MHAFMWVLLTLSCPLFAGSVSLSGDDANGYFAMVGGNREPNIEPDEFINDPTIEKFFDYPRYTDPDDTADSQVFSVEPYKFGLTYPTLLHPTGPGTFVAVNNLTEGFSEDGNFNQFNIGSINYDDSTVTGVGQEVIGVADITLTLDGSEFRSTNRTDLDGTDSDVPPFGPEGRSNFNEFANTVTLEATNLVGTGLTFQDGVLVSIDFTATATVNAVQAAFNGTPLESMPFTGTGTLTFAGDSFNFDIDDQSSLGPISDLRLILNRSGTIAAVQSSAPSQVAVPIPAFAFLITFIILAGFGLRRLS